MWSMAWVDDGLVRQGTQLGLDTVEERLVVSAWEVTTTYVATEEYVAREDDPLARQVVSDMSCRMSWHEEVVDRQLAEP